MEHSHQDMKHDHNHSGNQHHDHEHNHENHREHKHSGGHAEHHAHMAEDFLKRFWISIALTIPILILSHLFQNLLPETRRCNPATF